MFHYLFRTHNLVNGKVYYGVHRTTELLMDVPVNSRLFWPTNSDVQHDLSVYGAAHFHHGPLEAFTTVESAQKALSKAIESTPELLRYNKPLVTGPKTQEVKDKIAAAAREWTFVHNGKRTRKVLKEDLEQWLEEGWKLGNFNLEQSKKNTKTRLDPAKVALVKERQKAQRSAGNENPVFSSQPTHDVSGSVLLRETDLTPAANNGESS